MRKILIALIHSQRPESNQINEDKVEHDAKSLYEAGDKKWGTDESKFIQILCNRRLNIPIFIISLFHISLVMYN